MSLWDSSLASALLGAIVGSVVSAVPTYLLAIRASRETLKRDWTSRAEHRKVSTYRALVKLAIVVNRIGALHRHIERSIEEADRTSPKGLRLWQKLEPMIGLADQPIWFEADDLVAFASANEHAYMTDLLQLTEAWASLASAVRDYTLHRKKLTDHLAEMATLPMKGRVASISLSEAEAFKLEPRSVELEAMAAQLRAFAAEDNSKAETLAAEFGPKARAALADNSFPSLGEVRVSQANSPPEPRTGKKAN